MATYPYIRCRVGEPPEVVMVEYDPDNPDDPALSRALGTTHWEMWPCPLDRRWDVYYDRNAYSFDEPPNRFGVYGEFLIGCSGRHPSRAQLDALVEALREVPHDRESLKPRAVFDRIFNQTTVASDFRTFRVGYSFGGKVGGTPNTFVVSPPPEAMDRRWEEVVLCRRVLSVTARLAHFRFGPLGTPQEIDPETLRGLGFMLGGESGVETVLISRDGERCVVRWGERQHTRVRALLRCAGYYRGHCRECLGDGTPVVDELCESCRTFFGAGVEQEEGG